MSAYARYIGNYSGAETPSASLKGLRVYLAEGRRAAGRSGAAAIPAQVLDPARDRNRRNRQWPGYE